MSRFEEFPFTSADMQEHDAAANLAAVPADSESTPAPLRITVSEASAALNGTANAVWLPRRRRVERPTTSAAAAGMEASIGRMLGDLPELPHYSDADLVEYDIREGVDADDRVVMFDDEEQR